MGKSQIQRIVLGINFGHDSSAVVVADGKVVAAVAMKYELSKASSMSQQEPPNPSAHSHSPEF